MKIAELLTIPACADSGPDFVMRELTFSVDIQIVIEDSTVFYDPDTALDDPIREVRTKLYLPGAGWYHSTMTQGEIIEAIWKFR